MEWKKKGIVEPRIVSLIRKKYSHLPENELEKKIENIQNWLFQLKKVDGSLNDILTATARTIFWLFDFKEVAIGLRSKKDGMYRYEILLGFTKDAEKALRELEYTLEEVLSYDKYPGIKLSSITDFCLSEEQPFIEGEEQTYNRPLQLLGRRKAVDDFLEGDYIDINFYDSKLELLGWLELSNTKNGKLPERESLKWLELIATIIGILVERERYRENKKK